MKIFNLILALLVAAAIPSLAQVTNSVADNNTAPTTPAPVGQAPDDVVQKLSGLVHAQKYTEAQQLASGLLLAYPDDQRLLKAKSLLDKLLPPSSQANITPDNTQAANSVPAVTPGSNTTPEQLTGMDKVEYNSLIELGHEAQQTTDLDQQKASLNQFMSESSKFLMRHPDEMLLWELRAASALSLDDMLAGYEAGQKLLASGMADNDQTMQRLLSQMNIKGWLDKDKAAAAQLRKDNQAKCSWLLGTWNVSTTIKGGFLVADSTTTRGENFIFTNDVIEGFQINNPQNIAMIENMANQSAGGLFGAVASAIPPDMLLVMKGEKPDMRGTIQDTGEISWEYLAHDGWAQVLSCDEDKDQSTMTVLIDSSGSNSRKKASAKPVTMVFTKGEIQEQQSQVPNHMTGALGGALLKQGNY